MPWTSKACSQRSKNLNRTPVVSAEMDPYRSGAIAPDLLEDEIEKCLLACKFSQIFDSAVLSSLDVLLCPFLRKYSSVTHQKIFNVKMKSISYMTISTMFFLIVIALSVLNLTGIDVGIEQFLLEYAFSKLVAETNRCPQYEVDGKHALRICSWSHDASILSRASRNCHCLY